MTDPTRIGRYEIVRRLGKSMTDVYLAIDTVENRKAALKLVKNGGDAMNRLVMEAERRGAAIQRELQELDPRMVRIYEFGDEDGYFYVAMQYIEGRNLAEELRTEQRIEPQRAAVIAIEICEQLAKFHSWQSTVVHGDIKPSNIHLGPNDTVRLLDFGIAKTLRANCDATMHNFGSPSYCSPERLARNAVDQQSDLWAVGATLYEMLSGAPPYRAGSTRKLEELIRSRRPPRALPEGCPRTLALVVSKALAPKPERRYGSAEELRQDLQNYLEHRQTQAETERRARGAAGTMEVAREYLRRATHTVRSVNRALKVAGAAGWFTAGMVLWIAATLAVQAWVERHKALPPAHTSAVAPQRTQQPQPQPQPQPDRLLPVLYTAEADSVLQSYRESADPALDDFDWPKAEALYNRALQLGATDGATAGRLALSRGYGILERLGGGGYSEAAVEQLRKNARAQFSLAAARLPLSPDPHLALARLYVYWLPNVKAAMAELAAAQRLGAVLGRREIEQQGDAYRIRAARESGAARRQDALSARAVYERVPGFDRADAHLREIERLLRPAPQHRAARRRWR